MFVRQLLSSSLFSANLQKAKNSDLMKIYKKNVLQFCF
ncbi:MAG: hypothetical protein K0S26_3395 [Bacteroidota bacterium]|jgi:hypothetical protein|nr:hypothetical protein [Bacteroidota bacterium]